MIDGRKLVYVTPAGRLRYMRELVPFILSEPMVDRYDIWPTPAIRPTWPSSTA